jgi:hypothetical protein
MHGVIKPPALSHGVAPTSTDGSQVTTYDYTHGSKEVRGKQPVGMKKLPARAGAGHVVAGSGKGKGGGGRQVGKPSRRGK